MKLIIFTVTDSTKDANIFEAMTKVGMELGQEIQVHVIDNDELVVKNSINERQQRMSNALKDIIRVCTKPVNTPAMVSANLARLVLTGSVTRSMLDEFITNGPTTRKILKEEKCEALWDAIKAINQSSF